VKLALTNRVPRQYDQSAIQEIVRLLEREANRISDAAIPALGTEVATTSGTSVDVTGIPSWVTQLDIAFVGLSTNGTSPPMVQLGDAGGIENSGYLGAGFLLTDSVVAGVANYTTGIGLTQNWAAATVLHGILTLMLEDASQNTWTASGGFGWSNALQFSGVGASKSLSGVLDRIRLTTVGGANTFDAGAMNIRMN
jgi:hypothetical protein